MTIKKYPNHFYEKIPVKVISDVGDKDEMNKYSFNRKSRRTMASIERKSPTKDKKFKLKSKLQEDKEAHLQAIKVHQEKTHLKCKN